jgi:hypothetical protein
VTNRRRGSARAPSCDLAPRAEADSRARAPAQGRACRHKIGTPKLLRVDAGRVMESTMAPGTGYLLIGVFAFAMGIVLSAVFSVVPP